MVQFYYKRYDEGKGDELAKKEIRATKWLSKTTTQYLGKKAFIKEF